MKRKRKAQAWYDIFRKRERAQVKYDGWIHVGRRCKNLEELMQMVNKLKKWGVQGSMVYDRGTRTIDFCEVHGVKTMDRLLGEFPEVRRENFSVEVVL